MFSLYVGTVRKFWFQYVRDDLAKELTHKTAMYLYTHIPDIQYIYVCKFSPVKTCSVAQVARTELSFTSQCAHFFLPQAPSTALSWSLQPRHSSQTTTTSIRLWSGQHFLAELHDPSVRTVQFRSPASRRLLRRWHTACSLPNICVNEEL